MRTAAAVIAASVLVSRILGLVRDALIAGLIGVNTEADLYFDAFLIPDLLNYFLAGAYLTITLVPILSRHLEAGDPQSASRAFTSPCRSVASWSRVSGTKAASGCAWWAVRPKRPRPRRGAGLSKRRPARIRSWTLADGWSNPAARHVGAVGGRRHGQQVGQQRCAVADVDDVGGEDQLLGACRPDELRQRGATGNGAVARGGEPDLRGR